MKEQLSVTDQSSKDEVWSRDDEFYAYQTLGDLLDSHDDLNVGDQVYVGEREDADPASFYDADDLIEHLGDRAYDNHGEAAEGWPDVPKEAKAEFDAFLAEWIAKWCPTNFYRVLNTRSYTITAEDIA